MPNFVTAQGLVIKTVQQILDELTAQQRADIAATLNTDPDSPIGQLNGTFAAQLREAWEVLDVAYNGFNPDAAENFLLEALAALTGTIKHAATKGTVELTVDLDAGTTLLAGVHFASVTGFADNRWTPQEDYTAAAGGAQAVDFEAEFAGVVTANAGTITVIATPIAGWNSATNANDATPGTDADTDAQLRTRREEELQTSGSSTVDAIRADLLRVTGILEAAVFENPTDVIDANGVPPKSIECVVFDGDPPTLTDEEIAQPIFDSKAAGIGTFGNDTGTALDSLGNPHTIKFSRPDVVMPTVELDITVLSTGGFPGATFVEEQIVTLNTTRLFLGRNVLIAHIVGIVQAISGVIDVDTDSVLIQGANLNLAIGPRELARLDTANITVNVTTVDVYP